jgi:hypothetical protein
MKLMSHVGLLSMALAVLIGCGGSSSSPNPALPPVTTKITFTTTPPVSASEGQTYSYALSANTNGSKTITYKLVKGPATATLSGNSLTWVPSAAEARTASDFSILASDGSGSSQQDWSVTPSGTVSGTRIVNYVTTTGDVLMPDDVSQFPISADLEDGASGFIQLAGTGDANGSYSIPEVPGGHYWLTLGPATAVWTSATKTDTGYDALGRPNAATPSLPMSVNLELSGLNPWQSADLQQIYAPNTNTWLSFEWGQMGVNDGTATISRSFSWTDPLIDASQDDQVYVTQLVTTPTSGAPVQVLARAAGPLQFTQWDGVDTNLTAHLEEVEAEQVLHASIQGSAFAQLETAINPSALPDSTYFYVDVQPEASSKGLIGNTPDLIWFDGTENPIRTDIDMGDIAYGDPYPESWSQFLDYIHYVSVRYTAPGATVSTDVYGYIEIQSLQLPSTSHPVAPFVGPVSSPVIGGNSFFADQSNVTTTPTLSWSAPAVGTANGYKLEIFRLFTDGTDSFVESTGAVYTKATTIQLPPGMLSTGNSYFFCLSAIYQPGSDFETAPSRRAFPTGEAQALSGIVVP